MKRKLALPSDVLETLRDLFTSRKVFGNKNGQVRLDSTEDGNLIVRAQGKFSRTPIHCDFGRDTEENYRRATERFNEIKCQIRQLEGGLHNART